MRACSVIAACLALRTGAGAAPSDGVAPTHQAGAAIAMAVLEEGAGNWLPVRAGTPGAPGCKINITATNSGLMKIVASNPHVRTRLGWWKDLNRVDVIIGQWAVWKDVWTLDFYCNASRRYRFELDQGNGARQRVVYYPSSSSFTTSVDIKLGDLAKYF